MLLLVVVCGSLSSLAAAKEPEKVLFDFDSEPLGNQWAAVREIRVTRAELPEKPAGGGADQRSRPSGEGAHVETSGRAALVSRQESVPDDWRDNSALSFWLYCSPEARRATPKSDFEIRLYDEDDRVAFWRHIETTHTGWRRFDVPLKWMRWGDGKIPHWDEISRLGFWFRGPADVWIDSIALAPGDAKNAALLGPKDIYEVAFPGVSAGDVQAIQNGEFLALSDAAELDGKQLGEHLEKVVAAVRREIPLPDEFDQPATLLVFATQAEFQAFTPRLARALGALAAAPTSSGFTTHGIATSYWDPQFGTLRPVYTHEFVHALLARGLRLPNTQEWFHEGYATLVQRRFHPQENLAELINKGLDDPSLRLPLARVCDGQPIPLAAYWQAMTVIEMLLESPKYRDKAPELLAAFVEAGSTDLGPHLTELLESNWLQLTDDWIDHCREKYPVEAP